MANADHEDDALANRGGGLFAMLRRLIAGAEIDRLKARIVELSRQVDAAAGSKLEADRSAKELDALVRKQSEALTLANKSAARDLEGCARRIAELEQALQQSDAQKNEAVARLAEMKQSSAALQKQLRETEQRSDAALSTQGRTRDLERAVTLARSSASAAEKRSSELEASLAELSLEIALRDQSLRDLERRLVEAMAEPADEDAQLRERRDIDALVEELEVALAAQRGPAPGR